MRQLQKGRLPDPDREARIAEKVEELRRRRLRGRRRGRVHCTPCYMNAREFITTEQQLDEEIEKIFVEHPFGPAHNTKTNIWDAYGAPPTVQEIGCPQSIIRRSQRYSFIKDLPWPQGRGSRRLREELTGGKMD